MTRKAQKDKIVEAIETGPRGTPRLRIVIQAKSSNRATDAVEDLEDKKFMENSAGLMAVRAFSLED